MILDGTERPKLNDIRLPVSILKGKIGFIGLMLLEEKEAKSTLFPGLFSAYKKENALFRTVVLFTLCYVLLNLP